MDLSRVLVVVFSMVASELSYVHSKPADFVCNGESRRVMNKVKELKEQMVVCSAIVALPSPIHLPCASFHKETWEKKSVHERRAEILQSLDALQQDVESAMTLIHADCGFALLKRLKHSVNNYRHVIKQLHIEGEEDGARVERCPVKPSNDLGLVLKYFGNLLSGKLELLVLEIAKEC